MDSIHRCDWVTQDAIYRDYHDHEWGVPVHDDILLFEMLILEGAQAGLSWYTILKKRENYRAAFASFDPRQVATFTEVKVIDLLQDPGIVRNRLKVASAVGNARAFLALQNQYGTFSEYLWNFVDGKPLIHHYTSVQEVPAHNDLSDTISKDLKHRGFRFVGTTIIYSYLQAVGVVMDHIQTCFRYHDLKNS